MKSISIFFLLLFISCSKSEVNIEIKNKSIKYCVDKDSIDYLFNGRKIFKTELSRAASTNFIKINIENSTNTKYLFLLKDFNIVDNQNIMLNLYEDGKKVNIAKSYIQRADLGCEYNTQILTCMDYKINKFKSKAFLLKREGADNIQQEQILNYFNQSYVLHPDENILFYFSLKFPFVVEDNIEGLFDPKYFYIKKGKSYEFSISYKMQKGIEESLPKEVINNLKENNIEIFYGEIESNRIPVENIFNKKFRKKTTKIK